MEIEGGGSAFDYNPIEAQVRELDGFLRIGFYPEFHTTHTNRLHSSFLCTLCRAQGFIRINAVRLRAYNALQRKFQSS